MPTFKALEKLKSEIGESIKDDGSKLFITAQKRISTYSFVSTSIKSWPMYLKQDAIFSKLNDEELSIVKQQYDQKVSYIKSVIDFFKEEAGSLSLVQLIAMLKIQTDPNEKLDSGTLCAAVDNFFFDEYSVAEFYTELIEVIEDTYKTLYEIHNNQFLQDFKSTIQWAYNVYPELSSYLYKSSDQFYTDLKSRDDFPAFPEDEMKALVSFMYTSYATEYQKWFKKIWTKDITDVMGNKVEFSFPDGSNKYTFWDSLNTGAQPDPITKKTKVQDIILQAKEDVFEYAVLCLEMEGYLNLSATTATYSKDLPFTDPSIQSQEKVTINLPSIDIEFTKEDARPKIEQVISLITSAGGDDLLNPKKFKNGSDFLKELKKRGILKSEDINDVAEPSTAKMLDELSANWHKAHMADFRKGLEKVALKATPSEDDYNKGAEKVFKKLDELGVFSLSHRKVLFEEWSNKNYPKVTPDMVNKNIKILDTKLKTAIVTTQVANKLYTAWRFFSEGIDKLKAGCANTKKGLQLFAGNVDSVMDGMAGLSTLILNDIFQGVSFIRYAQLAIKHKGKYSALDKEFKANRAKLVSTSDKLTAELDKINSGSGDPKKLEKLQTEKATYDTREFYLSYSLKKKVKQIMEDIANAISAFVNLLAKILEFSGVLSVVGLTIDIVNKTLNTIKQLALAGRAVYKKFNGTKGKLRQEAADLFVNDAVQGEMYANNLLIQLEANTGNAKVEKCKTGKELKAKLIGLYGGALPNSSHPSVKTYNILKQRAFHELSSRSLLEINAVGRGIMKGIRSIAGKN